MRIGVLALQGDFAAHMAALLDLGVEAVEVRRCAELAGLDGLVIPGGESTTLLNLMQDEPWFDALRRFHDGGGALLGTCAGVILLAREVTHPVQQSLGLLDVAIQRNGFGRQIDSFETRLVLEDTGESVTAVFIRAPRIRALRNGVETLARLDGEPVLVRQGRIIAATFHPELTLDRALHRRFLDLVSNGGQARQDLEATPAEKAVEQRRLTC